LEDAAAEPRHPDGVLRQDSVVDGLPARAILVGREGDRLPVADVRPLQREHTVHPAVLVLAPGLHLPVLDVRELARLALHEDVVTRDERCLVMNEQVARGVRPLMLYLRYRT